jgi:hypothetical protein
MHDEETPVKWKNWYLLLAIVLALEIVLFYYITHEFS